MSWRALERVGIPDNKALYEIGAVQACIAVRKSENGVSLNLLYAMTAGLRDCHWSDISAKEKGRLLREADDLSVITDELQVIRSNHPRSP